MNIPQISLSNTKYFIENWKESLENTDASRLIVYQQINKNFEIPKHLDLSFQLRKIISKVRCSSHTLEIEKDRQRGIPRQDRTCKICQNNVTPFFD